MVSRTAAVGFASMVTSWKQHAKRPANAVIESLPMHEHEMDAWPRAHASSYASALRVKYTPCATQSSAPADPPTAALTIIIVGLARMNDAR